MRLLILLLVLFWMAVILVRGFFGALRGLVNPPQERKAGNAEAPGQQNLASRRLVRDPVCGIHVAEGLAVPLRVGGELLHFCSAACRDKYIAGASKMAANG